MREPIKKGMILSAGLGTRLLPITKKIPKPLVPVLNIPNILYGINLLKKAGIEEIIINVHHLPEIIENYLGDGGRWDLRISYSKETILMGTGGGVKKAQWFFPGQSFILVNCDFITNLDLKPVIEKHFSQDALCTMVLVYDPIVQGFYSKVGVDSSGHLCSLPSLEIQIPSRSGIFTGIHIINSEVLELLEEKPCGINEVLYPLLMKKHPERIFGTFLSESYWCDTGDPYFLWMSSMRLLEHMESDGKELSEFLSKYGSYEEKQKGIWIPIEEKLPKDCSLEAPIILGRQCKIGKNCSLGPYTIIGDNSIIDSDTSLSRFISLQRSLIRAEENLEGGLQFENSILPIKRLG